MKLLLIPDPTAPHGEDALCREVSSRAATGGHQTAVFPVPSGPLEATVEGLLAKGFASDCDVVIVNSLQPAPMAAARAASRKLAVRLIDSYAGYSPAALAAIKKTAFQADLLLVPSTYMEGIVKHWAAEDNGSGAQVIVRRVPYTTLQTSRGCAGSCVFCSVPSFYGRKVRVRSAARVIEEIRYLIELGYRELFFRDETFTAFRERNRAIFEWIIGERADVTWIANARVDTIDEESTLLMKRAGCHTLKFGLESGSDEILRNLRKGTTVRQARDAFSALRKAGIDAHAHMIIGAPGETEQTLRETLSFVKDLRPATASFGIVTPFPDTPLFRMLEEQGAVDGSAADMERIHVTAFHNE